MTLSPRQLSAAKRMYRNDGGPVWWRVGEGKTRIAYKHFAMIAKSLKKIGHPRFLVVCRREAFKDWRDEMKLLGLKGKGWKTVPVEEQSDIFCVPKNRTIVYLISHGKLAALLDDLLEVSVLMHCVSYDEGWLYKNPRTAHCKAANKLSATVGAATILSGSMMTARNLTDVYGQLYAINKHSILARTLTEFNSRFLLRLRIQFNPNLDAATVLRAQRGAGRRIAERIAGVASVYFPSHSSRRDVDDRRSIPSTRPQRKAYEELRKYYELRLKDHPPLILKAAPTIAIKCQQISDGWVKLADGTIVDIPSKKLDYVVAQVADLVACGEKVVIWTAYRHSARMVLQRLQKEFPKLGCYLMLGGKKFDVRGWQKNGRVAVATVGSGSSVNHFAQCAYAIYYSHDVSWPHMQQSRGRTSRKSSKHNTCYYYYLQGEGSMDAHIYKLVMSSCNEEQALIKATESWLKASIR